MRRGWLAILALLPLAGCFDNATLGDTVNAYNVGACRVSDPSDSDCDLGAASATLAPVGSGATCDAVFVGYVSSGVGPLNVTIDWGDGSEPKELANQPNQGKIKETHGYPSAQYTDFLVTICQASEPARCKYACVGTPKPDSDSADGSSTTVECPATTIWFKMDCTRSNTTSDD